MTTRVLQDCANGDPAGIRPWFPSIKPPNLNSCWSGSYSAIWRETWGSPRAARPAVSLMGNAVERTAWKAKYLSGSFTLQCCQKVYKNVIVSQLLVIILPFTLAVGNKKKKANIIFALLWPSSGLFQTIID